MRRGPGRRRKPTLIHELQNTLNAKREDEREGEPEPEGIPGDAPEDFTEAERAEWEYIRLNAPDKLFRGLDRRALMAWCKTCVQYDEAARAVREKGMVVTSKYGCLVKSPYFTVLSDSLKNLRILAEQLGFTPSGRTRIRVEKSPKENKWAKLRKTTETKTA